MNGSQSPSVLTLAELLPALADDPLASMPVTQLTLDSRDVEAGGVFVALKGEAAHGYNFAPMARENGARLILSDELADIDAAANDVRVIPGLRELLPHIASMLHGDPSATLHVTGVTGTNGKTTSTQLLAQVQTLAGERTGVIGTLGWGMPGRLQRATHTTADVISNQRMLQALRCDGAVAAAMEVSSHALSQHRVAGIHFQTAIFTNLSRDHLDYHGTLESYGEAKARLLDWPGLEFAVLNADDPFCNSLRERVPAEVGAYWYSAAGRNADVRASNIRYSLNGIGAWIDTPWGSGELALPLIGAFNLQNALAVVTAACLQGLALEKVLDAFAGVFPVAGRMERVDNGEGPLVLIDYAHTPDALEQALRALREHVVGRIWCVFGCGGDRDTGKRPLMGRLAHESADVLVVTSDNPRSEDPAAIIADICAGIPDGEEQRIVDRAEAIDYAVRSARAGDAVLVAGKGHEDYQEIKGERFTFSDADCVRAALARREVAS